MERVFFDKFYSHTHLSIIIEVSVVGVSQPLAFLCQGELKVVYNDKLTYCEDPASGSCVLPVPDKPLIADLCLCLSCWISVLHLIRSITVFYYRDLNMLLELKELH